MTIKNKCRICGFQKLQLIQDSKKYSLCPRCKFIFTHRQYFPDKKTEKERYITHNNSLDNKGYVDFLTSFLKKCVFPYTNSGARILDFGCGHTPVLSYLLEQNGYRVNKYDKYFYPDTDYKNQKYDIIVLVEVIEHLKDPLKTLKNLTELLSNNGILSINTRFHPGNSKDFLNWWYKRDPTHRSFFSKKTLHFLGDKLNFKSIRLKDKDKCVFSN
ncbi:MAG: class I SAM-dependent methyltransferase [Elusimicrobiota bacterium]